MLIKNINLKNYKKFNERKFEFSPGLNIIKGLNETGKSTLASALKTVLFTDVFSKAKNLVEDKKSWGANDYFALEMVFATDKGDFRLLKDFSSKNAELENLSNSKKTSDIDLINKSIEKSLGIETREIFDAVSLITQRQIAELNVTKDLKNAIQKSALIASKINPLDVLAGFKKEYNLMSVGLKGMAKNPGILKYLDNEINIEKQKYEDIKSKVEKLKNEKGINQDSEGKLRETEEKISILEKEFSNQTIFDQAMKDVGEIDERALELGRDIAEIERIAYGKKDLENGLEFTEAFKKRDSAYINQTGDEISSLAGEIKGILETLEEMQGKIKESSEVVAVKSGKNSKVLIIMNVIIGVFGLALSIIFKAWWVFLLMLPFSVISYFVSKKLTKEVKETSGKTDEMVNDFNEKQKSIEEKQSLLVAKLAEFECDSPDEFFSKKAQYVTLSEKIKEFDAMLVGRLREKTLDDLKKEQADLYSKKNEIEKTRLTEEVKNARVKPEDYLRKRRELDMLKLENRRLSEEFTSSKVRVEDSEYSVDDLIKSEERFEMLREEYRISREKYLALELNIKALESAISEVLGSANVIVRDKIEEYLPKITNKRYEKAKVDEDLGIQVFSADKRDFVETSELSSGTIDQIYFLARIALLDLVDKDKLSPLILDDPFVTFDNERLSATREILEELSKNRQIIFLTCHNDYDKWGEIIAM